MADAVGGARGSRVAPVGEVEDGEALPVQERHHVHGVRPGGAEAVHGDHPGVAPAGDVPGGQGPQFAGDLDVLVVQGEVGARVAAVQLGGEPDLRARFEESLADALQPAHDGVGGRGGALDHRSDDRVDAGPARPQVPGRSAEKDRVRVVRPAAVACTVSRRSAGRGRPGVDLRATSPAYRPAATAAAPTPRTVVTAVAVAVTGRTAPVSSGGRRTASGHGRTGRARVPARRTPPEPPRASQPRTPRNRRAPPSAGAAPGAGQPDWPYPLSACVTSASCPSSSSAGVRPGTELAVSQSRQSHSS